MARLGTKPPMLAVVSTEMGRALDQLSKAALIDAYVQALALSLGESDTAPTLEQALDDLEPLLQLRGDRVPDELRKD